MFYEYILEFSLHNTSFYADTPLLMDYIWYYSFVGWLIPSIFVAIWTITMVSIPGSYCSWPYNYQPALFYILETPRIIALLVSRKSRMHPLYPLISSLQVLLSFQINTIFLTSIMKIIYGKCRTSNLSRIESLK